MRRLISAVTVLLSAAVPGAVGPAWAEPLSGGQIQERAAGGEFRGDTRSFRGFESHIWRLAPDGRASAVAVARRSIANFGSSNSEFSDVGRWRIEGNQLCVDWAGPNRQFSGCYGVEAQQGNHVRLVGPTRWEGTLER